MPLHDPQHVTARPAIRFEITVRSLAITAVALAAAWILIQLGNVVLVVLVALIFAGTVGPAVWWLENHRVRRSLAIGVVFGAFFVLLLGLGLLIVPPLLGQLTSAASNVPRMQEEMAVGLGKYKFMSLAESVRNFDPQSLAGWDDLWSNIVPAAGGVIAFIGYLGSSAVLSIYLVADRERSRGALYAIIPRRYHVRLARIMFNLGSIVGGYMRGQLITSAVIFVFTFALLTVCDIEGALALAAFAGITDVIPFVGGLLAVTPAVLAALAVGPWTALTVLVAMVLYQEFESRVLVPRVYGRTLRLSSASVIVALLAGGQLLGIIGALLALPVVAALRMIVEELRVELPGDASPHVLERESDARAELEYEQNSAGAPPEEAAEVATAIADRSMAEKAVPAPGSDS